MIIIFKGNLSTNAGLDWTEIEWMHQTAAEAVILSGFHCMALDPILAMLIFRDCDVIILQVFYAVTLHHFSPIRCVLSLLPFTKLPIECSPMHYGYLNPFANNNCIS